MPNIQQNYYNPYQYQQQFGGYNVPSKGIEEIKKQENVAGKVTDNLDPTDNPFVKIKNFCLSLLASTGIVRLTNWSLRPKNITDDMKVIDTFTNSRMYKVGEKIDKLAPMQWISKQAGKAKTFLSKIPLPEFVKDFSRQYKIGSVSTWDKLGMYTLGKHSEAIQEFINFFSEVSKTAIDGLNLSQANKDLIYNLAQKVKLGKMNHIEAFKQIEPIVKNLSAKALKDISPQVGKFSKFLGAEKDLLLSFAKTQGFSGNTSSGFFGKMFNKSASLTGEASGGGVLGGKMALFMNAVGLITAFNAASNAEKGDKLKAFMEDYLAYTIGGYVMGMVVGKIFNHALGYAEFGMNLAKAQGATVADRLGLEKVKRVQDTVIGFNKEFAKTKDLSKIMDKINKGKIVNNNGGILGWLKNKITGRMTFDKAQSILKKYGIEVTGTDANALKTALNNKFISMKDLGEIRKEIIDSMKSNITLKSLKGKTGKEFWNQLGKWFVQKPVAKIAKWLSFGKYTLRKPDGWSIGNFFRRFKMVGGGISRMILVGIVLVSPFHKIFAKISHSIFGKPKKSLIDEEKNEKTENQNNNSQNNQANPNNQSVNLVDLYTQGLGLTPKEQKVQNQEQKLLEGKHDNATYVPNQLLTQESYIDPGVTQDLLTRRDLALQHADSAERNAMALLKTL